jgi:hypothetical protein
MSKAVKIHHLRDRHRSDSGAVTVAYSETQDEVSFGFAFCSPRDNFSKHNGVSIASERLHYHPLTLQKRGNRFETEKFVLRMILARDFVRLNRAASHVPRNFPNLVPGWLPKWGKLMVENGWLCVRPTNPFVNK